MTFTKRNSAKQVEWEVLGLTWLADAGGARVVKVLSWNEHELVEPMLESAPHTAKASEEFGVNLAKTHGAGARCFGCGPDGWDDSQLAWIGRSRLELGDYEKWGAFYADLRLMPYAKNSLQLGAISKNCMRLVERVCDRLRDGVYDDDRAPARIHGDMWAGNVLSTPNGLTLIDSAAHGGHPVTDLALLELFGFPYLDVIKSAYAQAAGLEPGWQQTIGLHQLHPLLVHAQLFGGGYGNQAEAIARRYA